MMAYSVERKMTVSGYKSDIFLQRCPEKYLCSLCTKLLKDPVQTKQCGHRYCRECLEFRIKGSIRNAECKACADENISNSILSLDQIYNDRAILREMSDVKVRCVNEGCNWRGTYKEYDKEHFLTCPMEEIICENAGCGAEIRRCQLTDHLKTKCAMRLVSCQYCGDQVVFGHLDKHNGKCSRYPTTCQYCKRQLIPREELKRHQDTEKGECPKKLVLCKFRQVGCEEMIELDKTEEHNKIFTVQHLFMLLQTLTSLMSLIKNCNDRHDVDEVKKAAENNGRILENVSMELKNLKTKVNQSNGKEKENADVATKGGSGNAGTVTASLEGLQSTLEDLRNKQTVLHTKVTTSEGVIAVLNNQLEHSSSSIQTFKRDRSKDRELIESLERKIKAQDRIIALKDVALAEQDLRIQSLEQTSYNGVLVWKLSDFKRKRHEAIPGKTTSIYSPCFYTSRHGYKMCARIYLNGDGIGKGNHVSLFFTIMKGPFDALLRWPFRQKVTLMWLDQNYREHVIDAFRPDPTSSSFKRPTTDMNIASGCPLFMPLSQLDSPLHAYVKDDVAFLKIMVDVSDLE
ncbi:TNF receptor-associated factor 2-like [Ptychodera flava]|uniref:TNF receptor-associated factor 2-like n=1 Tax=Ptychodera flava TaxID=63121 RepID=UPI00396A6B4D